MKIVWSISMTQMNYIPYREMQLTLTFLFWDSAL